MNNPEKLLSDEDKLQIATTFLTSLRSRNWQMMHTILTEDASWTLPGTSLLSGEAKGADAVVDRARKLRNFGVMVELLYILYSMEGVAVSLHNTGGRGELKLDEYVVIVMELRDKKIARLTTHLHDVPAINGFFIEGII
jgi:ketosteroid isomerase-like protein